MFLTKRRKFIFSSLFLTAGLFFIQTGIISNRYLAIGILSVLSIPLTLWSLKAALKGPVWLVSWILPTLFTVGVGFFYFLLPASLLTVLPITFVYLIGLYTLFLSENIFAVAAIRTIQLFRSATAVSFLLTLVISFFLYDTILSFRLPFYLNGLLIFLITFLLFLHGCWSVILAEKINSKIFLFSGLISLGIGETAVILSFWPTGTTLAALFLTSLVYTSLGIAQAYLTDRLFKRTINEYLLVGFSVLLIVLFYTKWG